MNIRVWFGTMATAACALLAFAPLSVSAGPAPSADLVDVFFPTRTVGMAVGQNGSIVRTDNGGKSWKKLQSGVTESLRGVYCVNAKVAWVCGDNGLVLSTTDGGASWTRNPLTGGTSTSNLNSIQFIGPENGWVCGDNGTLLHTENGGLSWQNVPTSGSHNLTDMHFVNSFQGWIVGGTTVNLNGKPYSEDIILHTEDGGNKWVRQQSQVTPNYLRSVYFVDGKQGWAVGDSVMYTKNGGKKWSVVGELSRSRPFHAVTFWGPQRGWIGGERGALWSTTDGGKSWRAQKTGVPNNITGLFFNDEKLGVAINGTAIVRTSDWGQTWTRL